MYKQVRNKRGQRKNSNAIKKQNRAVGTIVELQYTYQSFNFHKPI